MAVKDVRNSILEKRKRKQQGLTNSIEWPFAKYSEYFPGWEMNEGRNVIITAAPGVGKTQLATFLTVPVLADTESFGIWFILEGTERDFVIRLILAEFYNKGVYMTKKKLDSLGDELLSDEEAELLDEIVEVVERKTKHLVLIDNIGDPDSIMKKTMQVFQEKGFVTKEGQRIDNMFLFIVVDHISLLKGKDRHTDMARWMRDICVPLLNRRLQITTINIQQQDTSSQKREYDNKGGAIQKEPTLADLSDNKQTPQDADYVFALYSPHRHGIAHYGAYDISKHGDKFRALIVLKDRHYGTEQKKLALHFHGAANYFSQLND